MLRDSLGVHHLGRFGISTAANIDSSAEDIDWQTSLKPYEKPLAPPKEVRTGRTLLGNEGFKQGEPSEMPAHLGEERKIGQHFTGVVSRSSGIGFLELNPRGIPRNPGYLTLHFTN